MAASSVSAARLVAVGSAASDLPGGALPVVQLAVPNTRKGTTHISEREGRSLPTAIWAMTDFRKSVSSDSKVIAIQIQTNFLRAILLTVAAVVLVWEPSISKIIRVFLSAPYVQRSRAEGRELIFSQLSPVTRTAPKH